MGDEDEGCEPLRGGDRTCSDLIHPHPDYLPRAPLPWLIPTGARRPLRRALMQPESFAWRPHSPRSCREPAAAAAEP